MRKLVMSNIAGAILFLFCVAFAVPTVVGVAAYKYKASGYDEMIKECEKKLTLRSEKCEIVAAPVKDKNK